MILYFTIEDRIDHEYAIELMSSRLKTLGIELVRVDLADKRKPRLDITCQANLTGEAYALQWFPNIDPQILVHKYHTLTLDRTPALAPLYAGHTELLHTGRILVGSQQGLIFAVLEFCDMCDVYQDLPQRIIDLERSPKLTFRSACLLLMKSGAYDLDICEQEFAWFYDKQWWLAYLDFLVSCRYNAVTIWNYFPFPYFVSVPGYEHCAPVSEDQLRRNQQLLEWLTQQLTRRNMTMVFHFYCIYVPKSFADAIGMPSINQFTEQQRPEVYAYISACLSAFAKRYDAIGVMPCLGEGIPGGDAELFAADVLIPALTASPHKPVMVVRQWASLTTSGVRKHLLGQYDNLFVMIKHNAEHIASEVPDGRTTAWVNLGVPCLINMHMISEVGPFRWAPTHFINRMCLMYQAIGIKGIHVYPHWPWRTPDTGDTLYTGKEIYRDRLYHEAFGRYSFDPVRDQDEEDRYWTRRYRAYYGDRYVSACLNALNLTARSLTRLQQHLWIHYDNHSVLSAGYRIKDLLAARSMHGRKVVFTEVGNDLIPLHAQLSLPDWHWGQAAAIETNLRQSLTEVTAAMCGLESTGITDDQPDCEASFLLSDIKMMRLFIRHLEHKITAVRSLFRLMTSRDPQNITAMADALAQSVTLYHHLSAYADNRYAGISDVNPVIPVDIDVDTMRQAGKPYHWRDILPVFEDELAAVSRACDQIHRGAEPDGIVDGLIVDLDIEDEIKQMLDSQVLRSKHT